MPTAFSAPTATSEKGHYVVGRPQAVRAVRQTIGLLPPERCLMCSGEFWNYTGFQKTDQVRSPDAKDSAESSDITTEKRHERSIDFWSRTNTPEQDGERELGGPAQVRPDRLAAVTLSCN